MSADRAAAPSGVVTFLFTDVEGSTRRWEADADGMRAALAAHDEVLRGAIEAHGGFMFKHTGDGVCAAFASPRSAVDAAVAAQRALELPVRMGLATGEAELREGDYFGAVLNRAARVMAAGHGGQVLLDGTTAGLVSGIDLISWGHGDYATSPNRRDVPSPGRGSAREFPPLEDARCDTGKPSSSNDSFIGRESELAEVQEALKAHRLVTLTGVGGVGKTRLATEVAARLADDFPDGVWVFELAAVSDPAAVPDAVAAVLGITQQPGKTVADSVAAALEGRVRLLVFDNCEHVLDAAADIIEAILAHSATVKIVATSREGLRVADEQLWPVPSLDVGAGSILLRCRCSSTAPAALRRASRWPRREECGGGDLPAPRRDPPGDRVGGIPDGVDDGHRGARSSRSPLPAAGRIAARSGAPSNPAPRRAMVLRPTGGCRESLLARCSVFAGGFDLPAVCAVGGTDDEFATLDLLDSLVGKSLLVPDRTSGRTRFSMLETIREFAQEQLVTAGEPMSRNTQRATSRTAKPTFSHCGTAPDSAKRTYG